MRIEGADVNHVVQNGHASVYLPAAAASGFGHCSHVFPEGPAGQRIQRRHAAARLAHIHDAVDHHGRRLHSFGGLHLINPDGPQMPDVGGGDPIQTRVTLRAVVAGIRQPVGGIGLTKAVEGNLRGKREDEG